MEMQVCSENSQQFILQWERNGISKKYCIRLNLPPLISFNYNATAAMQPSSTRVVKFNLRYLLFLINVQALNPQSEQDL